VGDAISNGFDLARSCRRRHRSALSITARDSPEQIVSLSQILVEPILFDGLQAQSHRDVGSTRRTIHDQDDHDDGRARDRTTRKPFAPASVIAATGSTAYA